MFPVVRFLFSEAHLHMPRSLRQCRRRRRQALLRRHGTAVQLGSRLQQAADHLGSRCQVATRFLEICWRYDILVYR
jgi:hypothetical protein